MRIGFLALMCAGLVVLSGCASPEATENAQELVEPEVEQIIEEDNTVQTEVEIIQEEVVVDEEVNAGDLLAAFSRKYPNREYSEWRINILENSQNEHVHGTIGAPEGGGANFWAAKVNGEWVIVTEAQDHVPCSTFDPYGFPEDMIANICY
jgi:hypothetical protein